MAETPSARMSLIPGDLSPSCSGVFAIASLFLRYLLSWLRARHELGLGEHRVAAPAHRQMWTANPTRGSPRIRDELAKLGLKKAR